MVVKRIRDLKIKDRGLLTAIYGHVNDEEYFVDDDLRKYSISQQLFLYLKEEGFTSVVFYDGSDNYHSFCQEDLVRFFNLVEADRHNERQAPPVRRRALPGPLGTKRLVPDRSTSSQDPHGASIQNPAIKDVPNLGAANRYFRTETTTMLLEHLKRCLEPDNRERVAVVFRRPETARFDIADKYIELFGKLNEVQRLVESPHRVLVVYNSPNAQALWKQMQDAPSGLFSHSTFQEKFFNHAKEIPSVIPQSTYQVSLPDQTEIHNWLNRERIASGVAIPKSIPSELAVLRLTQERKRIQDMAEMDLPKFLERIDTTSAWDQLDKLRGIENITEQLRRLIMAQKRMRLAGQKVRPHMCFKGNPGTGKTTVAKCIASILKEEGLLSIGHSKEVSAKDLISSYVGDTRIKTQAACDEARGGVLFIDEAHGLFERSGEHNYGQQAIEVLMQFMENDPDSLVILAGYPAEIERLLKESDPGFSGRFSSDRHFVFNDYDPPTMVEIAESQLTAFEVSPSFWAHTGEIFRICYQRRTKGWHNARWVEDFIQQVLTNYFNTSDPCIDSPHIPAPYRQFTDPGALRGTAGSTALDKLDSEFIGLNGMKRTLKGILNSIKADRLRSERVGSTPKPPRLNFVFRGLSGTGKTKVARVLGEILYEYGLLSSPEILECRREDVVGQFQGHTAPKVKEMFTQAIGRVLFIDEAYSICSGPYDSFGKEAINSIVGNLTDPNYDGRMAIVMAGYPKDINEFIAQNQGMSRRFNYHVDFDNYSSPELWEIYQLMVKGAGLQVLESCEPLAVAWFDSFPRDEFFENAGLAERLFGLTKAALDSRVHDLPVNQRTEETLTTILEIDFPNHQA